MLSVFQRLKLLRRLYKAAKEEREVHVPQTTPKPSHWRRWISRYGLTTDIRIDSFLDILLPVAVAAPAVAICLNSLVSELPLHFLQTP